MAHKVFFSVPAKELHNTDLVFSISEDGQKLGELRISRGGVDWWPRDAKKKRQFSWKQLASRLEKD